MEKEIESLIDTYNVPLIFHTLILRLHYRSGPNRAEPNRAGPTVQTMLAWFGQLTSAQFYDCLHCQTN